jgi:hypothetical protein
MTIRYARFPAPSGNIDSPMPRQFLAIGGARQASGGFCLDDFNMRPHVVGNPNEASVWLTSSALQRIDNRADMADHLGQLNAHTHQLFQAL